MDQGSIDLKKYGAVILCGGQSRRMGFDKSTALLNRQGVPLLAALAAELAARFGEVALVTNDPAKFSQIPELSHFKFLTDLHPGAGPAGAIHTALKGLPGQALFVMACDMPVVNWPLITGLCELLESRGADIAVPRHGDLREPLYGFYGPSAEPAFAAGLAGGLRKVWLFYDDLRACYLDLKDEEIEAGVFKNLNTPADILEEGLPLPLWAACGRAD